MEGCFSTHMPSSPLYNTPYNAGTEEDYEASASSMAEEGLEDEDDEDEEEKERDKGNPVSPQYLGTIYNKNRLVGSHKHRRMSSGNSSADSTVNMPPIAKSNKPDKKHKFTTYEHRSTLASPFQNQYLLSRKRFESGQGLTSGYDGDTEGPLIEDKQC